MEGSACGAAAAHSLNTKRHLKLKFLFRKFSLEIYHDAKYYKINTKISQFIHFSSMFIYYFIQVLITY